MCRAFRALQKNGSQQIGGALVSFANSAKAQDMQSPRGLGKPSAGSRSLSQGVGPGGARGGPPGMRGGGLPKPPPQVAGQATRGGAGKTLGGGGPLLNLN